MVSRSLWNKKGDEEMGKYMLLAMVFGVGRIGNILIREAGSRAARVVVGVPMMILMLILAVMWWQA